MLRPWLAAALLLVPLAGCSGGSTDGEPAAPAPTAGTTTPGLSEVPTPLTDTLYLLDPPHLAGTLPTGGEPIRTYVPSDLDNLESGGALVTYPKWTLPRPDLTELDVTIRLWIDVQGVVTNPPRGAFNCFWAFSFFVEHLDGSRTGLTSYCRSEVPVVPEGIQMQEHSFVQTPDVILRPGDRLGFDLNTYGAYAPDARIDILSGTAEHDSSVTITGLQLPLDTQTLLLQ